VREWAGYLGYYLLCLYDCIECKVFKKSSKTWKSNKNC